MVMVQRRRMRSWRIVYYRVASFSRDSSLVY
jgi:hypothetical protein